MWITNLFAVPELHRPFYNCTVIHHFFVTVNMSTQKNPQTTSLNISLSNTEKSLHLTFKKCTRYVLYVIFCAIFPNSNYTDTSWSWNATERICFAAWRPEQNGCLREGAEHNELREEESSDFEHISFFTKSKGSVHKFLILKHTRIN